MSDSPRFKRFLFVNLDSATLMTVRSLRKPDQQEPLS